MRLSEDKISHLSHLFCDGAARANWVEYEDAARVLKLTKKVLTEYAHLDDARQAAQ